MKSSWGGRSLSLAVSSPPSVSFSRARSHSAICTRVQSYIIFYEHENPLIGLRGPDGEGKGEGGESEREKQGGRVGGGE